MSDFDDQTQLEQRLRHMRPAPAETLESEVLYRCGWEAAMASQAERRKGAAPFGLGLFSGIAATTLLSLIVSPWAAELSPTNTVQNNSPNNSHQDRLDAGSELREGPLLAVQENSEPREENLNPIPTVAGRGLPQEALPGKRWRPEYLVSMANPVRNNSQESEALSLAAQHRWANTLNQSPNQGTSPESPAQGSTKTLAEMLFEAGQSGLF